MVAGAKAFLHKPYSAEEILRVTRAVLDRETPGPAPAPTEREPTLQ
jgi:DNA-binding response OmpR family regulator